MLTEEKPGEKYKETLYYFCSFSLSLKLIQNKKLNSKDVFEAPVKNVEV